MNIEMLKKKNILNCQFRSLVHKIKENELEKTYIAIRTGQKDI